MRIVMTLPWGERLGGAEEQLQIVLEGAHESGHEIELVFFQPGRWPAELGDMGFRVEVLPAGRFREVHRWPGTVARLARIFRERQPDLIVADLVIGFRMFRERFTSRVSLDRPQRIDVAYADGPFRYLNNHWTFTADPEGCRVGFFVDFEFKSRVLQKVIEVLFSEAVRRMVGAFERRARDLYGSPLQVGASQPAA